MITLLDLHRWNAGTFDKNENWLFTIHFTIPSFQSHCVRSFLGYRHPSSFWYRIKIPSKYWNSWCHPLKNWHSLEISIRQSNALRSSGLICIFTLNQAYYRSHPISTSFSLSWTTKCRFKKWYFENVSQSKTTNNFYVDSW